MNVDINEFKEFKQDYADFKNSLNEKLDTLLVAVRGTKEQPEVGLLEQMRQMKHKDVQQDDRIYALESRQREIASLIESDKSQESRITDLERWKQQQITIEKANQENNQKLKGWREVAIWAVRMAISLGTLAIGAKLWLTGV